MRNLIYLSNYVSPHRSFVNSLQVLYFPLTIIHVFRFDVHFWVLNGLIWYVHLWFICFFFKKQKMDFEFDYIFPQLDKVPPAIDTILADMIQSYVETKQKKSKLPKLSTWINISIVKDMQGNISYLYKIYTTDTFART